MPASDLLAGSSCNFKRMAGLPATVMRDPDDSGALPELDAACLGACKRLDPVALRKLVVCYQPTLFAYFSRSLGYGAHVQDLAQEAFLRAFRALPALSSLNAL